jgi:hypothetical protein
VSAQQSPKDLFPRESFSVPLARLSVSIDEGSRKVERVRISYGGSDDYVNIGPLNDEYVKMSRKGRETTVFRESWQNAMYVTEFEGEHLHKVTGTLVEALEILESDLHKGNWARCHYLDGYLPRFMRGFYYLCDAMVCSQARAGLPRVARIPEIAYDVSLVSPKTDKRIARWRQQTDYIIKLRIAAKELVYQFQRWQKAAKDDPSEFFDTKVKKAYVLFVRIYFNLTPPARAPKPGDHL